MGIFKKYIKDYMRKKEWKDLVEEIEEFVEDDCVEEFYIGRTNDLDAREEEHRQEWGCDELFDVYESDDKEEPQAIEEALIAKFDDWETLRNRSYSGEGRWGPPPYYVYIAVKYQD